MVRGFEKYLWQDISEDDKDNWINQSSEGEYALAYHHAEVLGQFASAIIQNNQQRKHDLRDIYMAENVEWILSHEGENKKALIWARNEHIEEGVANGRVDVLGHQLSKTFGEDYFSIATDFGTGMFRAFPLAQGGMQTYKRKEVDKNTFTCCLQELGKPNVFLNLREVRNDNGFCKLITEPQLMMSGAGVQIRRSKTEEKYIVKNFDGIIYLDMTTEINFIK